MTERLQRLNFNVSEGLLKQSQTKPKPKPLVGCGSSDGFDSLWRINVAAAVLHALLAIMILAVGIGGNSTFQIVVTRSLPIVPSPIPFPFNTTTCNNG